MITRRVDGIHQGFSNNFFNDGVEGFIVPPRDVDALVQRLESLIQDEPLRQRMSEAALKRVAAIGGWDAYGARWAHALCSRGISARSERFDVAGV